MDNSIELIEREVESIEDETLSVETPDFKAFRSIREASRSWASILRDAIDKRSTLVATGIGIAGIAMYGKSIAGRAKPLGTPDVVTAGVVVTGIVALTALYCLLNGARHARSNEEDDPP